MSEYIVELPNGGAADDCIRLRGYEKSLYGYELREEITRCRDCKHYDPHPTDGGVCFLPDGDGDFARWEVEPDGFCKWSERRDA